jgi:hypothetical protein
MNKVDLEVKIESLKNMITEGQQKTSNYAGQLDKLNTELANINKPVLTEPQFDDIYEAVEGVINNFDWNDTDNFEIEYGISYDGKVECESHEFRNSDNLVQMVHEKVCELFKEADCPEDDNS